MLFINTRPHARAKNLTQALISFGVDVFDFPLLELIAKPLSTELEALYFQLPQVEIIVVVSPTAVQLGMQYAQKMGYSSKDLKHIEWIAVGDKTAKILKEYGFSSYVPDIETSEGMLDLPIFHTLSVNSKIAFWRGLGGRQFMMNHLIQQKMEVLNFILYERQCPKYEAAVIQDLQLKLQQHSSIILLVSSHASWLNWIDLMENNKSIFNKIDFWVLGDRLFGLLLNFRKKNLFKFKITKIENLKTESIVSKVGAEQEKT